MANSKNIELKRELGLFSAVNLIINTTIGSGIFVSPAMVYRFTGSVALCLIVWVISGLMTLLGALVYAELAAFVPRSGSAYSYIHKAFSPLHKFWGPLPSFSFALLEVVVLIPCASAIFLLTFVEYFLEFISQLICFNSDELFWGKKLLAMLLLCVITYLNAWSVKVFLNVQNLFTITKLLVCLVVIGGGLYNICLGNIENLQTGFEGSNISPTLVLAFVYGMFAFGGSVAVTAVTDEIKKPEVNILRSILVAQPFVAVFYLLMNISYMSVLTYDEMTSGEAVAVVFAQKLLAWLTVAVPLGIAISIFGTTMAIQFAITRLCHVAAQVGHMPEILSYVHLKYLTPYPAVLLQGILGCIYVLIGDVTDLIQFASVVAWILHCLSMIALIILRKTLHDVSRPIKIPLVFPVLFLIVSLFIVVVTIIADLSFKYLLALVLIVLCVPFYYLLVYKNYCSQWTQKVTHVIQALLLVGPMN